MNSFLAGPGALAGLRGLFHSILGLVSDIVLLSCSSHLHNADGEKIH